MILSRLINDKKIKYILVGGFNTVFGYAVFYTIYLFLIKHISYVLVILISHLINATIAFLLYRTLVFKNRNPIIPSFVKFNIALTSQLLLNLACTIILVEIVNFNVTSSQFIAVIISALFGYFAHKNFSFNEK
jgi:putative flippase GtrA